MPHLLSKALARQELARRTSNNLDAAREAVSSATRLNARNELKTTTASVKELQARQLPLRQKADALRRKAEALKKRLELKTEEARQLKKAEAGVLKARARLRQARIAVEVAELRLERMTVRALHPGRVMKLVAQPGTRLAGLAPGSLYDAGTVVTLYDPAKMQVRADVRLEDMPRVQPGQPVRIETAALPGRFLNGEVLDAGLKADIQKNTLPVLVAISAPPPILKNAMLVKVTFLAPASPGDRPAPTTALRLLVPRQLVEITSEGAGSGSPTRSPAWRGAGS